MKGTVVRFARAVRTWWVEKVCSSSALELVDRLYEPDLPTWHQLPIDSDSGHVTEAE